ncbi:MULTISPECIES: TIGR03564 family F420-dependent LLM class oxidoreductase [Tsukamurella]|uniref:TIGR03564 family F420-dependent LLM class oxidoreductase n=2 Tax=Tsukamurella TaxID=2060 RepID=A0A5C5S460_9ACTN|nr:MULTISPECIES: TIGR03564 family F420-dependent LLM class oxidoreductase [Tsukamurella]NMD57724.1 TIGR03564 family F420-dependent LLM class oxidoreductase [Tsukamurella columbiensis]TWS29438.1 TIGR03564 family F420-dependent LLM class oxidoreductase [Tsukamurella conjunctivitidis]
MVSRLPVDVGVALWQRARAENHVADIVDQARVVHGLGVPAVWFGQRQDHDATTLAAVVGAQVPGLSVGTSVVPLGPRHPLVLAGQAQTANAASGGRFTLGVGVAGPDRDRATFGVGVDRPIAHLREALTVLDDFRAAGVVDHAGDQVTARTAAPSAIAGGGGFGLLVAALGEQSLRAAGELADGSIPFLTGPRTIAERVVPGLLQSSGGAPRRVVAGVVVVVTDDADRVREAVRPALDFYATVPSYRSVFAAEGIAHPIELALIGDEETVARGLRRYVDAGATELYATQTDLGGPEAQRRTWNLLGALTRDRSAGRRQGLH